MRITNEGQYGFEIREDEKIIAGHPIDDPFIVSTIEFHLSRRDAIRAIFKPLVKKWVTRVWGKPAAYRAVFQGDYEPPPLGPAIQQHANAGVGPDALAPQAVDQVALIPAAR